MHNLCVYPSDIFSRMYAGEEGNKLYPKQEQTPSEIDDVLQTNIFNVMLNRRSQRKFENKEIEDWKLEMIFAKKVMQTIGTEHVHSNILCLVYPLKTLQPKPKRNPSELIHDI